MSTKSIPSSATAHTSYPFKALRLVPKSLFGRTYECEGLPKTPHGHQTWHWRVMQELHGTLLQKATACQCPDTPIVYNSFRPEYLNLPMIGRDMSWIEIEPHGAGTLQMGDAIACPFEQGIRDDRQVLVPAHWANRVTSLYHLHRIVELISATRGKAADGKIVEIEQHLPPLVLSTPTRSVTLQMKVTNHPMQLSNR